MAQKRPIGVTPTVEQHPPVKFVQPPKIKMVPGAAEEETLRFVTLPANACEVFTRSPSVSSLLLGGFGEKTGTPVGEDTPWRGLRAACVERGGTGH